MMMRVLVASKTKWEVGVLVKCSLVTLYQLLDKRISIQVIKKKLQAHAGKIKREEDEKATSIWKSRLELEGFRVKEKQEAIF